MTHANRGSFGFGIQEFWVRDESESTNGKVNAYTHPKG